MGEFFDDNPNFSLLFFVNSVLVLLSFLYEYFIEYNNIIITIIIMIIDIALLFYNVYYIEFNRTKNIKKSLIFMIVMSLFYLFVGSFLIMVIFNFDNNFINYFKIMKILVYLGPFVIVVGPIIYFIGAAAS
jgi:hypothetical protein